MCYCWLEYTMRVCVNVCVCVCMLSCVWLCDPMDCGLLASSVHGIFQARILEWVAISYSTGSSWPKDWTHIYYVSSIGRWILFRSTVCLLMLCLLDLSVTERMLLKFPTIIMNLSIFLSQFYEFFFIYFDALLDVYTLWLAIWGQVDPLSSCNSIFILNNFIIC